MSPSLQTGIILLVDDDPTSLTILRQIVAQARLPMETARSGDEAIERILSNSPAAYEAILTDYQMPGISGLELVERIRRIDSTLATILITSDSDRETLSSSLRMGVLDFLEKPVSRTAGLDSIVRATAHTRQQRRLHQAQDRLSAVAAIQSRLAPRLLAESHSTAGLSSELTIRMCSVHEAGGDFVTASRCDTRGTVQLVLGDVSGHGLLESFIASYFQGMVKGMQLFGSAPDAIAVACNQFLLHEWTQSDPDQLPSSLSAVFATLDVTAKELSFFNYGCPAVLVFDPAGRPTQLAKRSTPLGWFDELAPGINRLPLTSHGSCYLASDGLNDHARQMDVGQLALAARLLLTPPEKVANTCAQEAVRDDILVARLRWSTAGETCDDRLTVFFEEFHGSDTESIDRLQSRLTRNLALALPIPEESLHRVGLCTREAALNAMNHGCLKRHDLTGEVLACYLPAQRRLELTISDPGQGFTPPPADTEADVTQGDGHISLGLQLMRKLCSELRYARGGTECTLCFDLDPA